MLDSHDRCYFEIVMNFPHFGIFQKMMNCNFTLSYINQDADIQGFQFNCDAAIKEATLVRLIQT
jgi:hypothetical protein